MTYNFSSLNFNFASLRRFICENFFFHFLVKLLPSAKIEIKFRMKTPFFLGEWTYFII